VIDGGPAGEGSAGPAASRPTRPGTVLQGDRAKAYRPLPEADRRRAFDAAIAAYERGDFFEAHELLEPAWMGTDDLAERALHQGLIKLAAAYVHGVRRNPVGIAKNLTGAREHLARAAGTAAERWSGLDLTELLGAIDARLARLAAESSIDDLDPPALRRSDR
jgi:predicted metal-dependent hydrolase